MTFGEKIKKARRDLGLTQTDLSKKIGVSFRTVQNYELYDRLPKKRQVYYDLADALNVDVNYLLTDDEAFVVEAAEKYGSAGASQAENIISAASGLFAGGELSEEDKDKVMAALQDAYWDAKKKNSEKYSK